MPSNIISSVYRTVAGDHWDKISLMQLGSESFVDRLIAANMQHADVIIFPVGVELALPDVPSPASLTLPPWVRRRE